MSTVINFKTDIKIKKRAQVLAEKFGLSLSDVMNVLLRKRWTEEEKLAFPIIQLPA